MSDTKRKDVYSIGKKNPNLPFHPAVRAGDFIFVSGQVAKDTNGNMLSGTIEQETTGTIEAIKRILAEEGATLADVELHPVGPHQRTADPVGGGVIDADGEAVRA